MADKKTNPFDGLATGKTLGGATFTGSPLTGFVTQRPNYITPTWLEKTAQNMAESPYQPRIETQVGSPYTFGDVPRYVGGQQVARPAEEAIAAVPKKGLGGLIEATAGSVFDALLSLAQSTFGRTSITAKEEAEGLTVEEKRKRQAQDVVEKDAGAGIVGTFGRNWQNAGNIGKFVSDTVANLENASNTAEQTIRNLRRKVQQEMIAPYADNWIVSTISGAVASVPRTAMTMMGPTGWFSFANNILRDSFERNITGKQELWREGLYSIAEATIEVATEWGLGKLIKSVPALKGALVDPAKVTLKNWLGIVARAGIEEGLEGFTSALGSALAYQVIIDPTEKLDWAQIGKDAVAEGIGGLLLGSVSVTSAGIRNLGVSSQELEARRESAEYREKELSRIREGLETQFKNERGTTGRNIFAEALYKIQDKAMADITLSDFINSGEAWQSHVTMQGMNKIIAQEAVEAYSAIAAKTNNPAVVQAANEAENLIRGLDAVEAATTTVSPEIAQKQEDALAEVLESAEPMPVEEAKAAPAVEETPAKQKIYSGINSKVTFKGVEGFEYQIALLDIMRNSAAMGTQLDGNVLRVLDNSYTLSKPLVNAYEKMRLASTATEAQPTESILRQKPSEVIEGAAVPTEEKGKTTTEAPKAKKPRKTGVVAEITEQAVEAEAEMPAAKEAPQAQPAQEVKQEPKAEEPAKPKKKTVAEKIRDEVDKREGPALVEYAEKALRALDATDLTPEQREIGQRIIEEVAKKLIGNKTTVEDIFDGIDFEKTDPNSREANGFKMLSFVRHYLQYGAPESFRQYVHNLVEQGHDDVLSSYVYKKLSHADTYAEASRLLAGEKTRAKVERGIQNKDLDGAAEVVAAKMLARKAHDEGDLERHNEIMVAIANTVKNAGQMAEIVKTMYVMDETEAAVEANRLINAGMSVSKQNQMRVAMDGTLKTVKELRREAVIALTRDQTFLQSFAATAEELKAYFKDLRKRIVDAAMKNEDLTDGEKLALAIIKFEQRRINVEDATAVAQATAQEEAIKKVGNILAARYAELHPIARKKVQEIDPLDMIVAIAANNEFYQDVWQDSRELIREELGESPDLTPEMIAFLRDMGKLERIPTLPKLTRTVNELIKKNNIDLATLVDRYDGYVGGAGLAMFIQQNVKGLSDADAKLVAKWLGEAIRVMVNKRKTSIYNRIKRLAILRDARAEKTNVNDRTVIDSIMEAVSLGVFSTPGQESGNNSEVEVEIRRYWGQKIGAGFLTDANIETIKKYMAEVRGLPETEEYVTIREQKLKAMFDEIASSLPVSSAEKFNFIRTVIMLSSPATMMKNVINNMAMAPILTGAFMFEAAAQDVVYGMLKNSPYVAGFTKSATLRGAVDPTIAGSATGEFFKVGKRLLRGKNVKEGHKAIDSMLKNKHPEIAQKLDEWAERIQAAIWKDFDQKLDIEMGVKNARTYLKSMPKLDRLMRSILEVYNKGDQPSSLAWARFYLAQKMVATKKTELSTAEFEEAIRRTSIAVWRSETTIGNIAKTIRAGRFLLAAAKSKQKRGSYRSAFWLEKGYTLWSYLMPTLMPFVSTMSNMVMVGAKMTPGIAAGIGLRRMIMAAKNETRRIGYGKKAIHEKISDTTRQYLWDTGAEMIGLSAIGTLVFTGALGAFLSGMLTGAPPENEKEKQLWYAEGKKPYSLKVGDTWVSYEWLEPIAVWMRVAAISGMVLENRSSPIVKKIGLGDAITLLTDTIFNATPFSGILESSEKSFSGFINNIMKQVVSQYTGGSIRWIGKVYDGYQRSAYSSNTFEYLMYRAMHSIVPTTLPIRHDVWGREFRVEGPIGDTLVDRILLGIIMPFTMSRDKTDDVSREVADLYERLLANKDTLKEAGYVLPRVAAKTITYEGKDYELSIYEQEAMQKAAGTKSYQYVDALMKDPRYKKASDVKKAKLLRKAYDKAWAAAREEWAKTIQDLPSREK